MELMKTNPKGSKLMENDTLKLTNKKVLCHAYQGLDGYLPLQANGTKCQTQDLYYALLGVAARQGTLERVCSDWTAGPGSETIRTYFRQQLRQADLPELEQRINQAMAAQLPARLFRRPQEVAMDFQDRPYYGKLSQEEAGWVTGPLRNGTNRYYRVATAYVMLAGLRVTLAVHFVHPGEKPGRVLKVLLRHVKDIQIQIATLFLDKGFDSITIQRFLFRLQLSAVIACTIRGKEGGGTRALCQGRKSYLADYTFQGRESRSFTARLAVCRAYKTAKRTGRMKRKATWLVFILIHLPDWSPKRAKRNYRRRFGIESSYRCAHQVLGWTTSPNPAYRFVLLGVSFFLLNVWILLRWLYTQVPRPGKRRLETRLLPLQRIAFFIQQALNDHYGYLDHIYAPAPPIL
jgi:Transposase DDE domain